MSHGSSAAYAKKVLALAEKGNPVHLALVQEAQLELTALLSQAAAARRGPLRLALAGGLMKSPFFNGGFRKAAAAALKGRRLIFIKAPMAAEEAAARIALHRRKTP